MAAKVLVPPAIGWGTQSSVSCKRYPPARASPGWRVSRASRALLGQLALSGRQAQRVPRGLQGALELRAPGGSGPTGGSRSTRKSGAARSDRGARKRRSSRKQRRSRRRGAAGTHRASGPRRADAGGYTLQREIHRVYGGSDVPNFLRRHRRCDRRRMRHDGGQHRRRNTTVDEPEPFSCERSDSGGRRLAGLALRGYRHQRGLRDLLYRELKRSAATGAKTCSRRR
jgi:hypothetical protein